MANPDGFNFKELAGVSGLVLLSDKDPKAVYDIMNQVQ
jgi:hypothetical protein